MGEDERIERLKGQLAAANAALAEAAAARGYTIHPKVLERRRRNAEAVHWTEKLRDSPEYKDAIIAAPELVATGAATEEVVCPFCGNCRFFGARAADRTKKHAHCQHPDRAIQPPGSAQVYPLYVSRRSHCEHWESQSD